MQKFSFLTSLVIGIMACGFFSSCEKDDPVVVNDNQQTTTTTSSTTSTPQSAGYDDSESNDPEGTIWYNISSTESMSLAFGNRNVTLKWYSPSDFRVIDYDAKMVRVGKVAGLNKIDINAIPEVGWTIQSACEPGYAYIIKADPAYNGNLKYGAIFVVDHIYSGEGIIGAKIKYCPFTPNAGWNK